MQNATAANPTRRRAKAAQPTAAIASSTARTKGQTDQIARTRSAKPLAERLASLPGGTEIACLDSYPPGLSFYLGRTLTIIGEDATPLRSNFVLYWMRHAPVRPATLVAPSQRDAWLASRETAAFILAPDNSRAELDEWLGSRFPVRATAAGWWGASVPLAEAH